ncbi:hypothetical protein C3Y87_12325 [Carbonactinospora thermoautotrophica]|uniref:hypothetical protein n=1 Tax=Carbonactinospora thermoautotrophica TaxID=1469144 RepID=UPI00227072BD|nr:hypothetical protein [Carbonactinospora thermoautotrophica]MCX9192184.1 hypothetical protein [Carbonactinospora thermoautotrophica]
MHEILVQYEQYEGGSAEAERLLFEQLTRDLMRVQVKVKERSGAADIVRACHAKAVLGTTTTDSSSGSSSGA